MLCFQTDTGAMAVLALSCMKKSLVNQNIQTDVEDIVNNIQQLVKKILAEKKEDGLIGNIFSTGEAMQVNQSKTEDKGGYHEGKHLYPFLLAS